MSSRVDSGVGVSDVVLTLCLARIDSGVGGPVLVLMNKNTKKGSRKAECNVSSNPPSPLTTTIPSPPPPKRKKKKEMEKGMQCLLQCGTCCVSVTEYMSNFEGKLKPFLEVNGTLTEEEACKLGKKNPESYPSLWALVPERAGWGWVGGG